MKHLFTILIAGVLALSLIGCAVMPSGNYNHGNFAQEVVADRQSGNSATSNTSLLITMPTNLKVGDLIEIPVVTANSVTITPGAGFGIHRSSGNHTFQVFWKIADGTEGASQTWSSSAAHGGYVYLAHRITGNDPSTAPTVGASGAGSANGNLAPVGQIIPAWGAANNLLMGIGDASPTTGDVAITSGPSLYSGLSVKHQSGVSLGTAFENSTTAGDNQNSPLQQFTFASNVGSGATPVGLTIAIKPHP